jgi:methionine aminopeptidase
MITACRAARDALDLAGRSLKPGLTTDDIDRIVHDEIIAHGAYPSPLNYQGTKIPFSRVCVKLHNFEAILIKILHFFLTFFSSFFFFNAGFPKSVCTSVNEVSVRLMLLKSSATIQL